MRIKLKENLVIIGKVIQLMYKASSKSMIIILILNIIAGCIVPVNLILWKILLDSIVTSVETKVLMITLGVLFIHNATQIVVSIIDKICAFFKEMHVDYVNKYISELILTKIEDMELSNFDDPDTYNKISKINNEAISKSMHIINSVIALIKNVISLVGLVAILLTYNPIMVIIPFIVFIPILATNLKIALRLHDLHTQRIEKLRLVETLKCLNIKYENIKEIKIYNVGNYLKKMIINIYQEYINEDKIIRKQHLLFHICSDSIEYIASFGLKFWILYDGIKKVFSAGDIVMYINTVDSILVGIGNMLITASNMYNDNLYLQTLFEFLDTDFVTESKLKKKFSPDFQIITFENVYFKYPKSKEYILKNINLQIEAKKSYLLVGLNGSGKTTLIKLLARLYKPTKGRILIDGIDIEEYNINSYRKCIGIVFQDYIKYPMSIEENIKFGNCEDIKNNKKMETAAIDAGISSFISNLSKGYKTQLQNEWFDGIELSIGQWQKIAISRAYFSDSPILIMDEPAASLDAIAEDELYNNVINLMQSKTCFMISHRFTTAKIVDQIFVLKDNAICESGTYQELMEIGGIFAQLFSVQAKKYI